MSVPGELPVLSLATRPLPLGADGMETGVSLAVVTVSGRLDHTVGWKLRSVISDCLLQDVTVLVLDLAALDTCDDAGLNVLSGAATSTAAIGGVLYLAAVPEYLRPRLADILPPESLPLYADVDAAVTAALAKDADGPR
ncbi:hypothetical protein GCM10010347_60840 [Streptomyces cirratus]|uniref:STAS domain-containing protein n=1 Tax=Streptomyces cirratus TaxID=68187 RepID=A0ABQ3F4F8_9ACTN|nr:STAS domain-containing protein [Streptomyces cirratus]GHB81799.1 hypothetical protein GCM10010347_60840 [Streptomyces cirratus]